MIDEVAHTSLDLPSSAQLGLEVWKFKVGHMLLIAPRNVKASGSFSLWLSVKDKVFVFPDCKFCYFIFDTTARRRGWLSSCGYDWHGPKPWEHSNICGICICVAQR
jgi:hypothetical protein